MFFESILDFLQNQILLFVPNHSDFLPCAIQFVYHLLVSKHDDVEIDATGSKIVKKAGEEGERVRGGRKRRKMKSEKGFPEKPN